MKLCNLSTLLSQAWNIALHFCGTWPTINVNLWRGVASANRNQWTSHSPQICNHPWKASLGDLLRAGESTQYCLAFSLFVLTYLFFPWFDSVLWIPSGQTHYNHQILELFWWPLALRKSPCVPIWSYLTFSLINHTIPPHKSAAIVCHAMEYQWNKG